MKLERISVILCAGSTWLLVMVLLISCGTDGSSQSSGNSRVSSTSNQTTPIPSPPSTGGVVLSVGTRTPHVTPTPQITPTPRVTPTLKVTPTPQVTPTPKAT